MNLPPCYNSSHLKCEVKYSTIYYTRFGTIPDPRCRYLQLTEFAFSDSRQAPRHSPPSNVALVLVETVALPEIERNDICDEYPGLRTIKG